MIMLNASSLSGEDAPHILNSIIPPGKEQMT